MTKPYYLDPEDENYISKTDLKKEAKELQDFATKLIKLSKSKRTELPVSDEMQAAFLLADKIAKKPDALRRHVQYMAKLLRDEDMETLETKYELAASPAKANELVAIKVEALRESILTGGDGAINDLISENDYFDRQKLRQLVRQANKELAQEKPGKNYKELFQYLKSGL